MSFGASPSDLVMLLTALDRLARTLLKEAVESFVRCARVYETFSKFARHLDSCEASHGIQSSDLFRHSQGEIARLLQEFFGKIKDFEPFLGCNRHRNSLRGAIAKIQWSQHAKALEDLRQDLETQMNTITFAILVPARPNFLTQVLPGFPGPESIPRLPIGDHFTFEDARRVVRLISFRDIPNWEHFHEFLLRVFPHGRRGHSAIAARSYVLHNADTGKGILPSSPCVKVFREFISPDERIEMSIIFPYEDSYTTICPKCKTRRRDTTNVAVTWDAIDPLTQLAIDDVRGSGLRAFINDFVDEAERNGYFNANHNKHQLKDLIGNNFPDSRIHYARGAYKEHSEIQDFLRVTVYIPQWPSFEQVSTFRNAERLLAKVMKGLQRRLELLQTATDSPLAIVGRAIGSRALGGRPESTVEFLRLAWSMYDFRTQGKRKSVQIIRVLAAYYQCAKESRYQFHPSVVKARCLLWTFAQVLALERKLLLSCAEALNPWCKPEGTTYEESSTFHKLFSVLFIPHVIVIRCTFDVLQDAGSFLFGTSQPPEVLWAIFQIIKDSRNICLWFCSDGHLGNYDLDLTPSHLFTGTTFTREFHRANSPARGYLESILRSGSETLKADMLRWIFDAY
ncbi:hypothetical protein AYO22_08714 [Fonsecaea multimorphosa]|nr:hypothetical protein AYO22_08714 [Fonsecaea multimorphosa]